MSTSVHDDIEFLTKQFLSCTPLNKFKWPDLNKNIDTDVQKDIINSTVNSELVLKYPIKQSYVRIFLKLLIEKLEQSGAEEIDDYVYDTYCKTISSSDEQSSMHYRHFLVNDGNMSSTLTIKESTNIISQGTTGLCSWKAAFYLAEWAIHNKEVIKGKNILELGSGVGLTGLAVINQCAPSTYSFSDCHPVVLKTLEENVRLNLVDKVKEERWKEILSNNKIEFKNTNTRSTVTILDLKWEEMDKPSVDQLEVDLVIAADVLYDSSTFEFLVSGLKELLGKSVDYAIIAATVRNESTISEFLTVLDKYNLVYEEETTCIPQIFIRSEDTPIRILKILKAK